MARRVLDVFLSSTALDLEPHRAAIHVELTTTGLFHSVRQEDFGSQDAGAVDFCRDKVKTSDIFIGLTGQRRGWEPAGDNARRSITEMEHDWAKEAGCRRYLYVAPDNFPVPGHLRDTDEQYARQQAFRKRVMDGGERIVSQKGFDNPERLAADIVKHLLTELVTSDLITLLRPELPPLGAALPEKQQPAIAAAVERLAEDQDVDLLALAKNPKDADLAALEAKLRARAEAQETQGQAALKTSAEYWRHIGALAFLHNTQKALTAYEKAAALDPLNPEGWGYLGELHHRLGNLDKAEGMQREALMLYEKLDHQEGMASCYGNLGRIRQTRGDLDMAEHMQGEALTLYEKLNHNEGMASAYGSLAVIHQIRGDLDKAEHMQREALTLYEKLGRKEGMASASGNLAVIHQIRGDLDKAEHMQREALALYEELGHKEGMASAYGNLGDIQRVRGDLDRAEEMHLKSLKLEKELGRKEGMVADYINLGIIHRLRGHLEKAEEMLRNALVLSEELGSKEGLARTHVNLGTLYWERNDLDQAEEMYRKGLALYKELGNREGMAIACHNLGRIYQARGDKASMCDFVRQARDLYREMGLSDKASEMEKWLRPNECGDA